MPSHGQSDGPKPTDWIYLSPPHMNGEEQAFVADVFASNWIAPLGPHVDAFEKEIAAYLGVRGAAALSSGTAAVHLALRALGVSRGDLVFCSSLTFVGSANPILYEGAIPVFIDSDPTTWNMSPLALRRGLQEAARAGRLPKAIIVATIYGQADGIDEVIAAADEFGVPVIEDAAQSLGAQCRGRKSGSFGKVATLSFNGNKIITTGGGGMLVSDDPEIVDKVRFWAAQARDVAPHYEHGQVGFNYRLSNVLAAIGRGQFRSLERFIDTKRRIFSTYVESLGDIPGVNFRDETPGNRGTHWLTTMWIDPRRNPTRPLAIIQELARHSIEARPVLKPLHLQPLFAGCRHYPHSGEESTAEFYFRQGLSFPSGCSLTAQDQDKVIRIVRRAFGA